MDLIGTKALKYSCDIEPSKNYAEAKALLIEYMEKFISQNNQEIANKTSIILRMRRSLSDFLLLDEKVEEAEKMLNQVLKDQIALKGPVHIDTINTVCITCSIIIILYYYQ
jgi:hypothetical protein